MQVKIKLCMYKLLNNMWQSCVEIICVYIPYGRKSHTTKKLFNLGKFYSVQNVETCDDNCVGQMCRSDVLIAIVAAIIILVVWTSYILLVPCCHNLVFEEFSGAAKLLCVMKVCSWLIY